LLWTTLNGTIVNTITVAVGGIVGVTASSRLPERYREIVLAGLGLVTVTLGIDAGVVVFGDTVRTHAEFVRAPETYGARLGMVMIASLLIGSLIGTALRLHERIEGMGTWIQQRFAAGESGTFAEGFLTASVIFCVGPLTLLGCLRNGVAGDPSYLYIKALLDGFCAVALAASLGWGVFASLITVFVFQGALALLARVGGANLDPVSTGMMNAVGGVILLGTALMILDIKRIPVANMLPGIFLPPLVILMVEAVQPGLLVPIAGSMG
jgi:uncharacterized membrane protein YqgA involved in biofilm formation